MELLPDVPLPTLSDIKTFQSEGVKAGILTDENMPQPEHLFCDGMYCRELEVPAGMCVVGKIHKHDHLLLVTSGAAIVISEFGRELVTAGHKSVSKAGVKRIVLAIEDTKFITVHLNLSNTQDLQEIEREHIDYENINDLLGVDL